VRPKRRWLVLLLARNVHFIYELVKKNLRKNADNAKLSTISIRKHTATSAQRRVGLRSSLLKRVFEASEAHAIWTGDITYIPTDEGWLYLAVVLDLFSRAVVGWSTSDRIDAPLVCRALERARYRFRPFGETVMHSDRGSQYTSDLFRKMLQKAEPVPLVQSNGFSCFDNAVSESFFHTLKIELVYFEHYRSRCQAHGSLFDYIESFYNNQRLHSSIGYVTPMEKLTGIINKAA
jgi:putative transposase